MKNILPTLLLLLSSAAQAAQPAAGVWALQQPPQPNGSLRRVTAAQIRLPAIAGVIIRFHADDVQDGYKWLDSEVARVSSTTKKKFGLLLMGEGDPKPWAPAFADKFNRITRECGKRYPDCAAWFPGGAIAPPGSSEEPHWDNPMPAECVPAFKAQVDAAVKAFPNASILWPVSAKDRSGRINECAAYLARAAQGRAMIGHNALKLKGPGQTPQQWLQTPHNRLVVDLAKRYGMDVEFEMVGPTMESRVGTRDINACLIQARRLQAMAGARDLHVRVYPDDLAQVK